MSKSIGLRASPDFKRTSKQQAISDKLASIAPPKKPRLTEAERFASKQDVRSTDECWPWKGSLNPGSGYGQFYVKRDGRDSNAYVHRYAYEQAFGEIPEGLFVLHKPHICTRKDCSNPAHLYTGDAKQNSGDAAACGTLSNGKLTFAQAQEIRRLRSNDIKTWTYRALAERFGVTHQAVFRVWKGKTHTSPKRPKVETKQRRPRRGQQSLELMGAAA